MVSLTVDDNEHIDAAPCSLQNHLFFDRDLKIYSLIRCECPTVILVKPQCSQFVGVCCCVQRDIRLSVADRKPSAEFKDHCVEPRVFRFILKSCSCFEPRKIIQQIETRYLMTRVLAHGSTGSCSSAAQVICVLNDVVLSVVATEYSDQMYRGEQQVAEC